VTWHEPRGASRDASVPAINCCLRMAPAWKRTSAAASTITSFTRKATPIPSTAQRLVTEHESGSQTARSIHHRNTSALRTVRISTEHLTVGGSSSIRNAASLRCWRETGSRSPSKTSLAETRLSYRCANELASSWREAPLS